ncbi:hypothetical protein EBS02_00130 [bacterium]|nr:hypothetical protein [bacterium]
MALSTIQNLRDTLQVGSRPNLFECDIQFPAAISLNSGLAALYNTTIDGAQLNRTKYLCKSAAIPSFTIGVIEVPVRGGRRVKIPGDRTFADWTVTFISDSGHALRKVFQAWKEYISTSNYAAEAIRLYDASGYDYIADMSVSHLRQNGTVSRQYKLFDCFPTDVGAIDLSFDSTDSISEFTVTFQYHYMTAVGGNETIASDSDVSLSTKE